MATTKSDEGINVHISKETMHKLTLIALIFVVGIVVIAGGLFIKERIIDPAVNKTVGKTIEENAINAVREYLGQYPGEQQEDVVYLRVIPADSFWNNIEKYNFNNVPLELFMIYYSSLPDDVVFVEVGFDYWDDDGEVDTYRAIPVADVLTNPHVYEDTEGD